MKVVAGFIPPYRSERCIEHYLPASAAEHSEVYQFITFETLLLDHCRFRQWTRMLSGDVHYRMVFCPVEHDAPVPGTPPLQALVQHDHASLCRRVGELADSPARGPGSPTQCRRLITNLSVSSAVHGKFETISYVLMSYASAESPGGKFCTVERHDRLCRAGRMLRIERREVLLHWNAQELAQMPIIV